MTNSRIRLLFLMCSALLLSLTFGCSGGGSSGFSVSKVLVSIEVAPVNPIIALGTTKKLIATGIYSDNSNQDISTTVTWSSSSTAAATVSNVAGSNGTATAVAAGSTTITATLGGISGSTTLTVTTTPLVSIQISPTNPSIGLGTTRQFTATGIFLDNTTQDMTASVVWNSSNTAVATVSNTTGSNGLAMALTAGPTVISATSGTISDSSALTVTPATLVSIQVTPANPSIARGTTRQFTATGIFLDNTTQDLTTSVVWSSSSTAIATVSNTSGSYGLATGIAAGPPATITATLGTVSGSTTLTVTSATLSSIQITPTNPSIARGTSRQFTATGIFSDSTNQDITASVTWSSSDATIATISNTADSHGLATAVAAGTTTITAALSGVSSSSTLTVTPATLVSIQVTPANPSIALGTTIQFTATGIFSDTTSQDITAFVLWISSSRSVAAVSNAQGSNGLATAVAGGPPATITATQGAVSGSTTLTVTSTTLSSIQIAPTNPSIALGTTKQFTATGIYLDNTRQDITASVTWSSSDATIATISNAQGSRGLATSANTGLTAITATLAGVSGSTALTVTSATLMSIQVGPPNTSLAKGTSVQFTATGIYSNGTSQDLTASVTWSSSDVNTATISNAQGSIGLATAVNVGPVVTITATLGTVSGFTTLTVTSATLVTIDVTPGLPNVIAGTPQQFTAIGTYSDNTTEDLTAFAIWSSSSTTVATISNTAGSNGYASTLGAGLTTITATFAGISGSTDLTVTAATLVSIQVTPTDPSASYAVPQQFSATGIYDDGSFEDLTQLVTWTSSNTNVATISNAAGSNGLATPVAPGGGTTIITASFGGVSGTTTFTVTTATLTSITISSATTTIALGTTLQFTATGNFSDATTQDITASVVWTSSNSSVSTISNVGPTNGLATAIGAGTTTITAALGSVTNTPTFTLTVTIATLTDITITPSNATIFLGAPTQFTAIGTFFDTSTSITSTQDLTTQVTWRSSNKTIATVSNTTSSKGLVTPLKAGGPITISATLAGTIAMGSTQLTVSSDTLTSIEVTPASASITVGQKQQFTATGHYLNGGTQDLTKSQNLTWSSSNTAVARIANVPKKNKGLATGVSAGSVTITAKMKGFSTPGTASLTVN